MLKWPQKAWKSSNVNSAANKRSAAERPRSECRLCWTSVNGIFLLNRCSCSPWFEIIYKGRLHWGGGGLNQSTHSKGGCVNLILKFFPIMQTRGLRHPKLWRRPLYMVPCLSVRLTHGRELFSFPPIYVIVWWFFGRPPAAPTRASF